MLEKYTSGKGVLVLLSLILQLSCLKIARERHVTLLSRHAFHSFKSNTIKSKFVHVTRKYESERGREAIFEPLPGACSSLWLDEICYTSVYVDSNGDRLNRGAGIITIDQGYFDKSMAVIEQRILQAGVRLAKVINNIAHFAQHHRR